jgi:LacI family transcriptional regulator
MTKATVLDVAKHAGLSVATVHRVLGNRSGASRSSREKVAQAVRQLRFRELPKDLAFRAQRELRFIFVIPTLRSSFTRRLVGSLTSCPASLEDNRIIADVKHVDFDHPATIVEALDGLSPLDYDGVALFAVDAPGVREAINRAVSRGLKTVCIITDVESSSRHYLVGADNMSAGRVAGTLIGRFVGRPSGKIAVILTSLTQRDQHDRYLGFEERLRLEFPHLRLLPVLEGYGSHSKNRELMSRLLSRHPDLVGLYSAGSGNSAIIDALRAAQGSQRVTTIVHELSDIVRQALVDEVVDAVINQNTDRIVLSAASILRSLRLDRPISSRDKRIDVEIYLKDNLPVRG